MKSVRVRKNSNINSEQIDVKLTLVDKVNDNYTVEWSTLNGQSKYYYYNINNISQSDKDHFYEMVMNDLYDSYVIKGFNKNIYEESNLIINLAILNAQKIDSSLYEIIQDPWQDSLPNLRKFGYDPYYLNNGASIYINWYYNNDQVGGYIWNDGENKELLMLDNLDKSSFTKMVYISAPSSYTGSYKKMKINNYNEIVDENNSDEIFFSGLMLDVDIINLIINKWKIKIPNYNLKLSTPSNEFNDNLNYLSPIDDIKVDDSINSNSNVKNKEKLTVLISNKDIKVREDILIQLFIGDYNSNGFIYTDEGNVSISDEYIESEYNGLDEGFIIEEQEYPPETKEESENNAREVNSAKYVPDGSLDMLPGEFKTNDQSKIKCCQIDGYPVNVNIANDLLAMKNAAAMNNLYLRVLSGFRPAYGTGFVGKSTNGVHVEASSQEELYNKNCKNGVCKPATARPGSSKHGSGIAIDFNTGSRSKGNLNTAVYIWLIKNSYKFGFVRTVSSEEWHFEYWPSAAKNGPYAKLSSGNKLFYADLGLNNLSNIS